MVFFTASMISHSTQLPRIVEALAQHQFVLYPSLAFAGLAFVIVLLAENARIPVDNPATHLELTMIHEAMILEYSARHLALVEWASSLKLFAYISIGIALFVPYGIAEVGTMAGNWAGAAAGHLCTAGETGAGRCRSGLAGSPARQDAHFPCTGVSGHSILAGGAGSVDPLPAGCMTMPYTIQTINLLASLLLLIAFAMLSQRRILSLINLFAWQGLVLSLSTFVVAYSTASTTCITPPD